MPIRAFVRALVAAVAPLALLVAAATSAGAQGIVQRPKSASPPWTFYMAWVTIAVAAVTLILALAGYLVQSKGWQDSRRGGAGGARE